MCVCLSELLLGVRPHSDSLSTFISCLAVRLQYSCMYVYSLCVYIDGYDCIVYALWSILYMCISLCAIFIGERAQQASLPSHLNCVILEKIFFFLMNKLVLYVTCLAPHFKLMPV